MWWMSRLTIMMTSLFLSFTLAASAYATEIQMGYEGNLVFEPNEVTVNAGDTVTFSEAGDYEFQCDPHAGAGMKGVIHVE